MSYMAGRVRVRASFHKVDIDMKVVAFLPAKGTSSRVQNKNTRIFNGGNFVVIRCSEAPGCLD